MLSIAGIKGRTRRNHGGLDAANLDSTTPFDLECPLMSLPAVFHTAVETVPCSPAPISPQTPKSFKINLGLFPSPTANPPHRRRVGPAIRATTPIISAQPACQPSCPFLRTPRCSWFSLQKSRRCPSPRSLTSGDVTVVGGCLQSRSRPGRDRRPHRHPRSRPHHRYLHRPSRRRPGHARMDPACPISPTGAGWSRSTPPPGTPPHSFFGQARDWRLGRAGRASRRQAFHLLPTRGTTEINHYWRALAVALKKPQKTC